MCEPCKSEEAVCKIVQVGESFLIWNSCDVMKLREHRIVGDLMGTVPRSARRQDDELTLPLRLILEEVVLLKAKGLAEVVRYKREVVLNHGEERREAYKQWIQLEIERQSLENHQRTLQRRLACAHHIALGRKLKNTSDGEPKSKMPKLSEDTQEENQSIEVTPEEIASVEDEMRAISMRRMKENELRKQIWPESPLFTNDEQFERVTTEIIPETEIQKLRCAVFADLWEKGYILTTGLKFGGDFLAYPGDPMLYHASYIVVCLPFSMTYDPIDIAAIGRLGTQVKKIVLLCTWDKCDGSKIVYKLIKWKRFESEAT